MYCWRNLYQHSQQGWEALNALLMSFHFRQKQHGGHSGGIGEKAGEKINLETYC
jgi:hypothetical protein